MVENGIVSGGSLGEILPDYFNLLEIKETVAIRDPHTGAFKLYYKSCKDS
jgi:hypothetical protein